MRKLIFAGALCALASPAAPADPSPECEMIGGVGARCLVTLPGGTQPIIIVIPPAAGPADLPTAECAEIAAKAKEYEERIAAAELSLALGDRSSDEASSRTRKATEKGIKAMRKRYLERLTAFDERCRP